MFLSGRQSGFCALHQVVCSEQKLQRLTGGLPGTEAPPSLLQFLLHKASLQQHGGDVTISFHSILFT